MLDETKPGHDVNRAYAQYIRKKTERMNADIRENLECNQFAGQHHEPGEWDHRLGATCLIGIFVEIAYIAGVITESGDGSYHDSDSGAGGGGISWPMAFTALYIIDKERKKDS